ncbi:MAG: hypothetical protein IJA92_01620, partial [Oscillospiraceae bacterium]|nr:hypothetical protein [Oscillospiraceae bacterium]
AAYLRPRNDKCRERCPQRSEKQSNPKGSLPRGEGGFFAFGEKDGRGITKNPKGSLPRGEGVCRADG